MATVLQDTFTDTNGTALTAHTMDVGPGWSVTTAFFQIQSNRATVNTTGLAGQAAWADASEADVTITVDLVIPNQTTYQVGVLFRGAGTADDYWFVVIQADGGTAYLALVDRTAATNTTIDSENFSVSPQGTTVTVTVTLSGTSLQASAPNVVTVSTTSATRQTATRHGLQGYVGTASDYPVGSWDNFLVTTAGGAAVTYPMLERSARGIERGILIGEVR